MRVTGVLWGTVLVATVILGFMVGRGLADEAGHKSATDKTKQRVAASTKSPNTCCYGPCHCNAGGLDCCDGAYCNQSTGDCEDFSNDAIDKSRLFTSEGKPSKIIVKTAKLENVSPQEACRGNACDVVSFGWTGHGYHIANSSPRRVRLQIRWAFGFSCMQPSTIDLAPKSAVDYGNGAYCNPYDANYP